MERKVALITGASSGIGLALANCFARDGHDVVLSARSVDKLQALAQQLERQHGIRAMVVPADLQSADGAQQLHAAVQQRGLRLNALVNNAGFGCFGEFKDTPLEPQLQMMQLNMGSLVALSRLFLPDLLATRGQLLNVASTAAFQPGPFMSVYFASKAFVLSFSEALAEELSGQGVTVSALCPGATVSGFMDKAEMQSSALFKGRRHLPSSEEVARAGYRALQRGQRVYVHGLLNKLMVQSLRISPRRAVVAVARWVTGPV